MSESDAQPQATQVVVQRSTGIFMWQQVDACLEWTSDNRIRVRDLNGQNQPGTVVFDSALCDITKAIHIASVMSQVSSWCMFKTADSKVSLLSLEQAIPFRGPEETDEEFDQRIAAADVPTAKWWIDQLKSSGVNATYWGFWKVYGIAVAAGLVGSLVLILIIFLVTVVGH